MLSSGVLIGPSHDSPTGEGGGLINQYDSQSSWNITIINKILTESLAMVWLVLASHSSLVKVGDWSTTIRKSSATIVLSHEQAQQLLIMAWNGFSLFIIWDDLARIILVPWWIIIVDHQNLFSYPSRNLSLPLLNNHIIITNQKWSR